jgi:cytoskeletal protein CcmA (bactofilin family)
MGRAPFPAPPPPSAPPAPRPGTAIPPGPAQMGSQAGGLGGPPKPAKEVVEKRTLVVGRGISVQGTVQDAERLVVEGTVEASMIHAVELHVAPGGVFRGEVQVQDAELAGTIDGTLTASGNLVVRATGRLLGTAKCRRLQVEDGGQVTGRLEMLPDPAAISAQAGADPFRPALQLPEAAHPQPEDAPAP